MNGLFDDDGGGGGGNGGGGDGGVIDVYCRRAIPAVKSSIVIFSTLENM